jgi:hypothetical protein
MILHRGKAIYPLPSAKSFQSPKIGEMELARATNAYMDDLLRGDRFYGYPVFFSVTADAFRVWPIPGRLFEVTFQ